MAQLRSLGADPEFFLAKGGTPLCAYGIVPGTKDAPVPVEEGTIQCDGTAAEIGITPTLDKDVWTHRLLTVRDIALEVAGAEMYPAPVVDWGDALTGLPEEATELGCDPDYNAYSGYMNEAPDARDSLRSAGGHVHFGVEGLEEPERLVRCCDKLMLVASFDWDKDSTRRKMYGMPGAYRRKLYGLEYRSLSNAWLRSRELVERVFDLSVQAFEAYNNGDDMTVPEYKKLMEMCNVG